MALGMMIDGEWRTKRKNEDTDGAFVRPPTTFRNSVTADGSGDHPAAKDRYHLYVSYACPWAHRTLILRQLKGLENVIGVSVVHPYMGEGGWHFPGPGDEYPGATQDPIHGAEYMREVYKAADAKFTGRVTVPVLWDKEQSTIVNNESREIIRMLDHEFDAVAAHPDVNLCPDDLKTDVEAALDAVYEPINNGVYRSGFATTQQAYEKAVRELFDALDHWDAVLGKQRYLCGDRMTEADVCMFTTLVRFDAVYYSHFKCNIRRIVDYENLWPFLRDIYQTPGVAETVFLDHIKDHYYQSHESVNPTGIVPVGPEIDFSIPHGRG